MASVGMGSAGAAPRDSLDRLLGVLADPKGLKEARDQLKASEDAASAKIAELQQVQADVDAAQAALKVAQSEHAAAVGDLTKREEALRRASLEAEEHTRALVADLQAQKAQAAAEEAARRSALEAREAETARVRNVVDARARELDLVTTAQAERAVALNKREQDLEHAAAARNDDLDVREATLQRRHQALQADEASHANRRAQLRQAIAALKTLVTDL